MARPALLLPLAVLAVLAALLGSAAAATASTSCTTTYSGTTISTTTCTGTAPNYQNSVKHSLTYDASAGKFSGTMLFNLCPKTAYNYFSGVSYGFSSTPSCYTQTIPDASYTTTPAAAPLRSAVAYSVSGANIFGPMDNGFTGGGQPDVCTNSKGTCAAGTDVKNCFSTMEVLCGTANVQYKFGLDDCGGHANPYHYHNDPVCEYSTTAAGHSALVGYALDGRGLYGLYESTGVAAVTDACNGHWGTTPAYSYTDTDGTTVSYAASTSSVYHYHTSSTAPFTIGCYGPPSGATSTSSSNDMTMSACKALYSSKCTAAATTICTGNGLTNYYLDCPCFNYKNTEYYNGVYTVTSACTNCTGSCATGGTSTTNSKTTSATSLSPPPSPPSPPPPSPSPPAASSTAAVSTVTSTTSTTTTSTLTDGTTLTITNTTAAGNTGTATVTATVTGAGTVTLTGNLTNGVFTSGKVVSVVPPDNPTRPIIFNVTSAGGVVQMLALGSLVGGTTSNVSQIVYALFAGKTFANTTTTVMAPLVVIACSSIWKTYTGVTCLGSTSAGTGNALLVTLKLQAVLASQLAPLSASVANSTIAGGVAANPFLAPLFPISALQVTLGATTVKGVSSAGLPTVSVAGTTFTSSTSLAGVTTVAQTTASGCTTCTSTAATVVGKYTVGVPYASLSTATLALLGKTVCDTIVASSTSTLACVSTLTAATARRRELLAVGDTVVSTTTTSTSTSTTAAAASADVATAISSSSTLPATVTSASVTSATPTIATVTASPPPPPSPPTPPSPPSSATRTAAGVTAALLAAAMLVA